MTTLMMILGGCLIGLVVGLVDSGKTKTRSKNKPRKHSVWDDDPFFGTPLQKIK